MPAWLVRAHAEGLVVGVPLRRQRRRPRRSWPGSAPTHPEPRSRACSSPSTRRAATSPASTTRRVAAPSATPCSGASTTRRRRARSRPARCTSSRAARHRARPRADVDVNSSPDNPVIGVRSFGADPAPVGRHGAAWVEGLAVTGVAACAKHFPGHGDTVVDSHHGAARVDVPLEVLRERELAPFRAAVEAGVATVMTSHIVVEALDAEPPGHVLPGTVHRRAARRARLRRRHRQRRPRHGRRERRDRHPGGRGARPRRRRRPALPRLGTPTRNGTPPSTRPSCAAVAAGRLPERAGGRGGGAGARPRRRGAGGARRRRRRRRRRPRGRRRARGSSPRSGSRMPPALARGPRTARGRAGRLHRQPRCRRRRRGARRAAARGEPSPEARGARRAPGRPVRGPGRVGADLTPRSPRRRRALRAAGHDVVLVECGWPRGAAPTSRPTAARPPGAAPWLACSGGGGAP